MGLITGLKKGFRIAGNFLTSVSTFFTEENPSRGRSFNHKWDGEEVEGGEEVVDIARSLIEKELRALKNRRLEEERIQQEERSRNREELVKLNKQREEHDKLQIHLQLEALKVEKEAKEEEIRKAHEMEIEKLKLVEEEKTKREQILINVEAKRQEKEFAWEKEKLATEHKTREAIARLETEKMKIENDTKLKMADIEHKKKMQETKNEYALELKKLKMKEEIEKARIKNAADERRKAGEMKQEQQRIENMRRKAEDEKRKHRSIRNFLIIVGVLILAAMLLFFITFTEQDMQVFFCILDYLTLALLGQGRYLIKIDI